MWIKIIWAESTLDKLLSIPLDQIHLMRGLIPTKITKFNVLLTEKPKNSFIFIATLELLMIKQMNSNMDESDTNM